MIPEFKAQKVPMGPLVRRVIPGRRVYKARKVILEFRDYRA